MHAAQAQRAELEAELSTARAAHAEELQAAEARRTELEAELETRKAAPPTETGDAQAQLMVDLEAAYAARAQLEHEVETLRALGDPQQLGAELQLAVADRAQLEAAKTQLVADLEIALEAHIKLEKELETLRASSGDSGAAQAQLEAETLRASAAELEIAQAARTGLEAELEIVRASASAAEAAQAQLAADLEIALANSAELEAAVAARTHLEGELSVARQEYAELAAELGSAKMSTTLTPELEQAASRAEALQAQLSAAEARMGAESAATREARDVAVKLKAQAEKLQAERDEARALARQLHLKLAAPKKSDAADLQTALDAERQVAANLVSERDQLNLRLEALGRMIDQERDGRARALSERDEWQLRFKSLARGSVDVSQPLDFSREETRSFMIERPTVPEIPAAKAEAITNPAIPKNQKGS